MLKNVTGDLTITAAGLTNLNGISALQYVLGTLSIKVLFCVLCVSRTLMRVPWSGLRCADDRWPEHGAGRGQPVYLRGRHHD